MKCKAALLLVILSSCNPLVKEGIEDAVIAVEAIEQHYEQEACVKPEIQDSPAQNAQSEPIGHIANHRQYPKRNSNRDDYNADLRRGL